MPGGVPHRGVLPARRLARGEGGHVHPDAAPVAVAGEGRRAAGRRPLRAVVLLPPRARHPGAAGGVDDAARPGAARPRPGTTPRTARTREPSAEAVLREINGYDVATGRPLASFTEMKDDGSTVGGCWIYTGVYADGVNQAARRKPGAEQSLVAPEWGWAWPANRRILYNRASADPDGNPWSERKALRLVGRGEGRVDRLRRAGLREDQTAVLPTGARRLGRGGHRRRRPVHPAGRRQGLAVRAHRRCSTGRCPTHYEPVESPVRNPLYRQQANPTRKVYTAPDQHAQPEPAGAAQPRCSRTCSRPAGSPSTTPPAG